MKNLIKTVFIFSLTVVCTTGFIAEEDVRKLLSEISENTVPNTLTEKEQQAGWQLLFNGTNFAGWHGYNLTGVPDSWKIENGVMLMTTKGGAESKDIITDKTYKNFALSLEFKLTKGANSGVIFQVVEDAKYEFPYETGPEFQVMDHEDLSEDIQDWQMCGANYAMYPPLAKPYKPVGAWNQVLIVADNHKVTQVLNGEITAEYEKYSDEWTALRHSGKWTDFPDYGIADEGHISLQNHGSQVYYRNIKIKEL